MAVSKKVTDRITLQLKKYQATLAEAKDRDISESDTVVIIADMLADILGYKKYIEITTEFAIRGTFGHHVLQGYPQQVLTKALYQRLACAPTQPCPPA